ncbi:MAG: TIGR04376 family protein, partial [Coleofasciculaceae cyanobacterium]
KAAQENVTRASSQSNSTSDTSGWNQTSNQNLYSNQDPLAEQFLRWETEEELNQMKRNMGL